ncbi:MAG: class I SAM-dependent methyltransferase [bacterium]|nr:class I SAM-dependent methyltransferase [bacterium]
MKRPKPDIEFADNVRGFDFAYNSTWGLFSPRGIDEGTRLMLDNVDVAPDDDCLDLGCGYGVIGLTLTRLAPQGETVMVDKDFVAVEYASKNIIANNITNASAYLSNGFSEIPQDKKFDVIASNLPAKAGNEMWTIFFADAFEYLELGGKIYVVAISALREYIKRSFLEIFGNYEKVKQGKRYTVSLGIKR